MALPNHPDVAHAFARTLLDCGYEWVLVQEHTWRSWTAAGWTGRASHTGWYAPALTGETASIVAVVKTQGSDSKLVGQMQPYYEAKAAAPQDVAGRSVPPLVTQIADGENGGVMMNEFPAKYSKWCASARGRPPR